MVFAGSQTRINTSVNIYEVVVMRVLKDVFCVVSVLFLLAMCFISPTVTTKVSFIVLLVASLVVMYLVREVDDHDEMPDFDPQATIGHH